MVSLLLMLAMAQPVTRAAPLQPAQAAALSDAELRERIQSYLGTIERPMAEAQWRALGAQAEPILLEIASGDGLPTRRAKAVEGLAALGGAKTPALLANFSLDESKPLSVRLAAVRGLAKLTPDSALAGALRPVVEGARDARVASAAAELVARRAPESGCALVRARGSGDLRFRRALSLCER